VSAGEYKMITRLPTLDSDQVARDVAAFGETVECIARNEVLSDLSFELDAMGAVLGHDYSCAG
jgi:hypothetical protein